MTGQGLIAGCQGTVLATKPTHWNLNIEVLENGFLVGDYNERKYVETKEALVEYLSSSVDFFLKLREETN